MALRRIVGNSATLTVGQGLAQLLSALAFLVAARSLGVADFGYASVLYGVALFVSVIVDFGAVQFWTRELAAGRNVGMFFPQLRSRTLILIVATGLVGVSALLVLWVGLPGNIVDWAAVVVLASLTALMRVAASPLRADVLIARLTLSIAFEKLVFFVLIFVLTFLSSLTPLLLLISACVSGTCALIMTVLLWPRSYRAGLRRRQGNLLSNPLGGMRFLGISGIAVGLQSLDAAIIRVASGVHAAGLYAAVGRWTQPMSLVASSVTQSTYADMARSKSDREALRILASSTVVLSFTAVPLVVVAIFSESLVTVLLGDEFRGSADVLRVLCLAASFGVLNSPMLAYLQARSDERLTSIVLVIAMPLQMALMAVLSASGGATAAALAVLVIQFLLSATFGFRIFQVHRRGGVDAGSDG